MTTQERARQTAIIIYYGMLDAQNTHDKQAAIKCGILAAMLAQNQCELQEDENFWDLVVNELKNV